MSDAALLGARMLVGGYLAAHGAQKLFGKFGGHGLEGTGGWMASLGLTPGRPMAAAAGGAELGGGLLVAAGLAHPVGPLAVASTMAVAAGTAHRGQGAFTATGGPELPLTNMAAAVALGAAGPGRYSADRLLGIRVPVALVRFVVVVSMVLAGWSITRSILAARQAGPTGEPAAEPVIDLDAEAAVAPAHPEDAQVPI